GSAYPLSFMRDKSRRSGKASLIEMKALSAPFWAGEGWVRWGSYSERGGEGFRVSAMNDSWLVVPTIDEHPWIPNVSVGTPNG
ncbi:MAG: hypothetical protein ACREFT_12680, partial [Acetobacteraceae bacterium]